ncbi:MAG TPA: hypothetical protein VGD31_00070, partial [Sphingobacteriaceae bacterium]
MSLNNDSTVAVLDAEIREKTLAEQDLGSFNNFINTGLPQIITQLFQVSHEIRNERGQLEEDKGIENISFNVKFTKVRITEPVINQYSSGKKITLYPDYARENNLNYSAGLIVNADITAKAFSKDGEPVVRTESVFDYAIADIPIMVGSCKCNTYNMSKETKKNIHEDPTDPGGYFIIKGGEWVIDMMESRLFNYPHIFRNIGYKKEITRLEFLSKPGDAYENSAEIKLLYLVDGNIQLHIMSNENLKKVPIPFWLIFRLFGMPTDKELFDNIVYDYEGPVSAHMIKILKLSFKADRTFQSLWYVTDPAKILDELAERTTQAKTQSYSGEPRRDETTLRYMRNNIMKILDKTILPHIGLSPESRHDKLRYLGWLIHKLLLVEMEIVPSTDRDSLVNKRIHSAGDAYAKVLKMHYNMTVIQTLKKEFVKAFHNLPFSQVPLAQTFRNSIQTRNLEQAIVKAIGSGTKEASSGGRSTGNRLASENLHRKNQMNFYATLRVIRTPSSGASSSKKDQRADEMRRVHPSYIGYIGIIQSADTGDAVGLVKQLALGAG